MEKTEIKNTVAVLVHVPKESYKQYAIILQKLGLKRQNYNSKMFLSVILRVIEENK